MPGIVGNRGHTSHRLSSTQAKVVHAIRSCRTAALGGHYQWCAPCGFRRYAYHSCRNRHCPKCQALAKAQWLELRRRELLPAPYYAYLNTMLSSAPKSLSAPHFYLEGCT